MKYHFIGDNGISMRGLKEYVSHFGALVSGSDLKTTGHKAENVAPDVDVVVRTSAVSPGSLGWVEVEAAKKMGIRVIKRSELLGEITDDKKLIAVSGMHGKTTVSTMAGLLLIAAGFDPTVLIGERIPEFDDDVLRIGASDWFVAEICEYDRSFLDIYPKILILTNIEEEHLDTFPGGLPEIKEAFLEYINHIPDDGIIIACHDDENVIDVLSRAKTKAKVIFYGSSSDKFNNLDFKLSIPGKHNVNNALAIMALADSLKIDAGIAERVLTNFKGAKRRFEFKGNFQGSDLIDDYGHHPTEIRATISALRERYPDKKRIVVFWPHQYKRILPLLKDFSESFDDADLVIVKPIFFVPGRDEIMPVSSNDIVDLLKKRGREAVCLENDQEIVEYLKKKLNNESVLLTIGIPPVYKISEELLKK